MRKPEYEKMGRANLIDLNKKSFELRQSLTPPSLPSRFAKIKPYATKAISFAITGAIMWQEVLPRMGLIPKK